MKFTRRKRLLSSFSSFSSSFSPFYNFFFPHQCNENRKISREWESNLCRAVTLKKKKKRNSTPAGISFDISLPGFITARTSNASLKSYENTRCTKCIPQWQSGMVMVVENEPYHREIYVYIGGLVF